MADTSFVSEKASGILIPSGYKAGTLYGIVPDNQYTTGIPKNAFDFTTARNSLGTRTNNAGLIETMANDVPRLQYPSCPSYLAEPARTNLVLWSEFQAGNTGWTIDSGNTPESGKFDPQPFEASVYVEQAGNYGKVTRSATLVPDDIYTISCFVKYDDGGMPDWGATGKDALFYLSNKSVLDGFNYESWGNGIWRVIGTGPAGTNNGLNGLMKRNYANERNFWVTGWQLEAGTYPTTYIKTEAATSNRAIDAGSVSDLIVNGILASNQGTTQWKHDSVSYVDRYTTDGNKESFVDGVSQGAPSPGSVPTTFSLTPYSHTEVVTMYPTPLTNQEISELN